MTYDLKPSSNSDLPVSWITGPATDPSLWGCRGVGTWEYNPHRPPGNILDPHPPHGINAHLSFLKLCPCGLEFGLFGLPFFLKLVMKTTFFGGFRSPFLKNSSFFLLFEVKFGIKSPKPNQFPGVPKVFFK
jgi:hypothetical protein